MKRITMTPTPPSRALRCLRCGALPPCTPEDVALVESHELCRHCRHADLRAQLDHIHADVVDLWRDMERTLDHVDVDDDIVRMAVALDAAFLPDGPTAGGAAHV